MPRDEMLRAIDRSLGERFASRNTTGNRASSIQSMGLIEKSQSLVSESFRVRSIARSLSTGRIGSRDLEGSSPNQFSSVDLIFRIAVPNEAEEENGIHQIPTFLNEGKHMLKPLLFGLHQGSYASAKRSSVPTPCPSDSYPS